MTREELINWLQAHEYVESPNAASNVGGDVFYCQAAKIGGVGPSVVVGIKDVLLRSPCVGDTLITCYAEIERLSVSGDSLEGWQTTRMFSECKREVQG